MYGAFAPPTEKHPRALSSFEILCNAVFCWPFELYQPDRAARWGPILDIQVERTLECQRGQRPLPVTTYDDSTVY